MRVSNCGVGELSSSGSGTVVCRSYTRQPTSIILHTTEKLNRCLGSMGEATIPQSLGRDRRQSTRAAGALSNDDDDARSPRDATTG